jgi:hypothetical protein
MTSTFDDPGDVSVERYQPQIEDEAGKLVENPKFDEERYGYWMREWRDTLSEAAPYYAPRLHATMAEVHHTAKVSISQKLDLTMTAAVRRVCGHVHQPAGFCRFAL